MPLESELPELRATTAAAHVVNLLRNLADWLGMMLRELADALDPGTEET